MADDRTIVLVQPGRRRMQIGGALLHLPLQHLSLAAWLRRDPAFDGHIRILDMNLDDLAGSDFISAAIVGISAMTGHQVKYGLEAARIAREANPSAIIVWGGVHPTLLPEETLANPLVDLVVIGEGEETFREVVTAVFAGKSLAGIPGTCVTGSDGVPITGPKRPFVDPAELPLPAYDLVDVNRYHGIQFQFDYQSSRGCPFRCGFCYNTVFCGRHWRAKPAEQVVADIEYIVSTYSVVNIAFADDEFFIDRKRAIAICRGLIDRGITCGLIASCRLDIVRKFTPDELALLKQAGMLQLFFGAESGSGETLTDIAKDITREDIIEGARRVAEAGIIPVLSFMSGFPGETQERFAETLDTVGKLWKLHPLITINGIFPFNAYPGTTLFDRARSLGLTMPSTLDAWGEWNFQYEPDNPWLTPRMRHWMQIAFYIVRFRYYLVRFQDRHRGTWRVPLLICLTLPLRLSAAIRWKYRWFGCAFEWRLFAALVRRTFGYL